MGAELTRRFDTGQFDDRYPYVRVGHGPETLLVIPGIGDAMFDGEYGRTDAVTTAATFRRFLADYTVYLVSRPRGLEDRRSIDAMARDYERVLADHVGAASVLGLSMGGLIAQELARERPDLVERLVLGVSGCRLAEGGRPIVRELHRLALEGEWTEIRARLYEAMFTGAWRRIVPTLSQAVGRIRPPDPAEPRDVPISFDAVRDYDGTDRLEEIEPRTLVIGGTADPFFPAAILRETHEGLPDGQLETFTGARHGVFLERKEGFDNRVREFLEDEVTQIREK
ncbi:alpha/beta hydrolase fold protein [Haloterrigena turkmenica DSM 5511]|uniref:Alpha/beta hydrolase fold protein n=1 Tax=Haloterrigena turkmenica (strain ATCC 51198 / DSM 5511 / JCM 9101 / NCIMB 13204 / VKM B-1734 / 4k) TaxID=543526 RepID=D2RT33_HALTV|nr:alpha/beta hydrolase [Haloterrigena turkmenica]ADB60913.1 alpha/beta hydrolase fold protein [Haloterrigena turkmenica DSM 5511]